VVHHPAPETKPVNLSHAKQVADERQEFVRDWAAVGAQATRSFEGPITAVVYNRLTEDRLGKLRSLSDVEHLSLEGTKVNDEDLKDIAHLSKLQQLDLDGTFVTGKGLCNLSGMEDLYSLSLNNTKITDDVIRDIGQLTNLFYLRIEAASRWPSFFREAGSRNRINRCSKSLTAFTVATAVLPVVGGLAMREGTEKVTDDSAIFTVEEAGERTVVAFRDWQAARKGFYSCSDIFVSEALDQLQNLVSQYQCKTLAVNMVAVDSLPSSFLGLLVSLAKGELQIELLHPSARVRQTLAITRLERFFTIRD
jgi:hypothetical protein